MSATAAHDPVIATSVWSAALDRLERWPGWPRVQELLEEHSEMELFLAGGGLRDVVLGNDDRSKDLDFFLAERFLDRVVRELERHGQIRRTIFGSPQWYPNGDGPVFCDLIAIERFHNGLGRCKSIEQAIEQFDFTANAIAFGVRRGTLFDPLGGMDDLEKRVMRAVRFDFPDEPVVPGHDLTRPEVLWFRLVHYTALLGFEPEPDTLDWLRAGRRALRKRRRYEEVFHPLHPRTGEVLARHGLG